MASSSVSHSESHSDTYIPEYSQTPILMEIAQHARAMSDYVYNWGMERFNKNQGDIDKLMSDALSYASPQRIAVDMGMAEAGVQQAAERGRLSAIRDLESYGIDPSSGRYAALDMSNRVMSAAAAAGAGNQQRMATQAAGNAMRNQAMAAGLQNAQFGLGVGGLANQYLNTASQLKYPPLGRYSDSVSDSSSGSSDGGGGGSKPAKDEKPPPQQQEKPGAQPPAGKPAAAAPPKDPKPPETIKAGPAEPPADIWKTGTTPFNDPGGQGKAGGPFQSAYDPTGKYSGLPQQPPDSPYGNMGIGPNGEVPGTAPAQPWPDPNAPAGQQPLPTEDTPPDTQPGGPAAADQPLPAEDTPPDTQPGGTAASPEAQTGMDMDFNPWAGNPDQGPASPAGDVERGNDLEAPVGDGQTLVDSGYDPYQENLMNAAFTDGQGQIDPVTGEPIETTEEGGQDVAGSLYGLEGGDWSFEGEMPTAADWGGDTQTVDFGDQTGTYDSTLDTWATEETGDQGGGGDITDYDQTGAEGDWSFEDYQDTAGDFADDYSDWTDTGADYDYEDYDYSDDYSQDDYDYGDDYADEDYADEDWADEDYADEDYAEEDYADEDWADEDYADEGDDSWEDYADEDYEDEGDDSWEDYADEDSDDGWVDDSDTSDWSDGGDSGGDGGDYARGGPVRKGRRRMPTGFRPRPMRPRPRPPGQPGQMPGAPRPGQMPGRRMDPPPQAPRPMRGAPQMARGGPRPAPMRTGMNAMPPGNMISANGMPPPTMGGMPRPQRLAQGGPARGPNPQNATSGGFVSRELSPSGGSKVDDVQARLNAEEFVIPKDVAMWKGKEFFYKMIAQARKNRSGGDQTPKAQTGYGAPR